MTKNKFNILVVADGHGGEIYDAAFVEAFKNLGHTVGHFTWKEYFHNYPYADVYPTDNNKWRSLWFKAQNKYRCGPALKQINKDLIKRCKTEQPNMVFIYRGTHIWPKTIKKLTKMGIKVMGYNNDDPFSNQYPKYVWRHFLKSVPYYSHVFAYRHANIPQLHSAGAQSASLLRSYYIKNRNFPLKEPNPKYACDLIFIGHYEPDGRDKTMLALSNLGLNIKLFGTNWQKSIKYNQIKEKFGEIKPLYGEDYNTALSSAKMALVFLSKLNNDTYTRRCFEIPAAGTLMVSEYTDDLATLFTPDLEAIFFKNQEELLEKINLLSQFPQNIQAYAQAGHERLLADGHSVEDRAQQVIQTFKVL